MAAFDPLKLLDRLEYVETRTAANELFQDAIKEIGILDGYITPNVPIPLINPFLEEKIESDVFGSRTGPFLQEMVSELGPLVRSGAPDMMVEHMRHSIKPLILSVDWSYTDPLIRKAAVISRDYGLSGVFMLPCHCKNTEYSAYGVYTRGDDPDRFNDLTRSLSSLHLLALYHDSACNIKFSPSPATCQPMLAPREKECLLWVAAGLSSKRIAYKLGISLHTVNEFIGNAMRKLDATTRAEAAAKAISAQLISP